MPLSIDLAGNTAVVSGAGGGLGRAISLDLARAGADVVLLDIAPEEALADLITEIGSLGKQAHYVHCNIADASAVRHAVAALRESLPSAPSILVNNAGHFDEYGAIDVLDDDVLDRTIDINLKGTFYMTREFTSWMRDEQTQGTVINIASGAAHSGRARHAHYSASKGGVLSATRAMAIDLSPSINVNSISVGFVDVGRFDDGALALVKKDILPRIPLGAGRATDISAMVCYLASPLARWITGSDFRIDGGESAGRIPLP